MICTFSEYDATRHEAVAGGKAGTLAKLYQMGYPVPDGFILTADCFDERGLKAELWQTIEARFEALRTGGRVAVRSSALAEDSASASYAGEFESVLGVDTVAALADAIDTVCQSTGSERVTSYRESRGLEDSRQIAAIVQRMVDADYAGVLFTVDPVTTDRNLLVGNLHAGLGDALVAGEVTGETFSYDRQERTYSGPVEYGATLGTLIDMAIEIEARFAAPQDIEWAAKDGRAFLLQCRPITTLSEAPEVWNCTLRRDSLWSNTNVGEAFAGIVTPMTWSVIEEQYSKAMGPLDNDVWVGQIAGRLYANLSLMLGLLESLGISRQRLLDDGSQMMGLVPDDLTIRATKFPVRQLVRILWGLVVRNVRAAVGKRRFLGWIRDDCADWCRERVEDARRLTDNSALRESYLDSMETTEDAFLQLVTVTSAFVLAQIAFRKALGKVMSGDDFEPLLAGLGGGDQLQSLGPVIGISRLNAGELDLDEFARLWGHRSPDEIELSMPRTSEDPDWIEKLQKQAEGAELFEQLQRQEERRDALWQRLREETPRRYRKLRKLFENAAGLAQEREMIRSELVRMVWVLRCWLLRVAEVNDLGDDVFFISMDELLDFLDGADLPVASIAERRRIHELCLTLPDPPSVISGRFDPVEWAKNPNRRADFYEAGKVFADDAGEVLRGLPGAAGVAEGTVRLLASHHEIDQLVPGEILVASSTNVGWTPVFPRVAAVITDVGAPLSHAAIVARELGIPAVVGTGSATARLQTGDRVRVVGSEGYVEILQ